jgi:hypothetical protein
MKLKKLKENESIQWYIEKCNEYIGAIGALEHSTRHSNIVSDRSFYILKSLNYEEKLCNLASIAGYFHDIGNIINRNEHGRSSALMLMPFLKEIGLDDKDISTILGALGNHEEKTGYIVNPVGAAVIIADKSELYKDRVRKKDISTFTPRDRVNFAVQYSEIEVDNNKKIIKMFLKIDTDIVSVLEYFEIFLTKMLMCQRAANFLECSFQLFINNDRFL